MKKKIIGILVVTLLIGTVFPLVGSQYLYNNPTVSNISNLDNNYRETLETNVDVFYDFIEHAPEALWGSWSPSSPFEELPFPGNDWDPRGFACYKYDTKLEDGDIYPRILETHPRWEIEGAIRGDYPELTVPPDSRLNLAVGFLDGAVGTDGVKFEVWFIDDENPPGTNLITTIYSGYDDDINYESVPLDDFADRTGFFRLLVHSLQTANRDWAVWARAEIGSELPYGDLHTISVEPVQVIYGAPLVKDKETVFRVKVDSTFSVPVDTHFRLYLPEEDWKTGPPSTGRYHVGVPPDYEYPEIWGPVTIAPGINDIILPYISPGMEGEDWSMTNNPAGIIRGRDIRGVYGPDVRVVPRPKDNSVRVDVKVDIYNEVWEINEDNNFMSATHNALGTKPWKFYFIPYLYKTNDCTPLRRFVVDGAKNQLEYLLANFPIADNEISYSIASGNIVWEEREGFPDYEDRGEFLRRVARIAQSQGYDFGVAVGCYCGGGAGGSNAAVFIGDCGGSDAVVLAHEFNHVVTGMADVYSLDCLVGWDEAYCEHPDGTREYFCYDDNAGTPDGTVGRYCYLDGSGNVVCRDGYVKNCVDSCGCSIYRGNDECKRVDEDGEYVHEACDIICCADIADSVCRASGGTVWSGPDGRIRHPASEGFWVNRWNETDENMNYFMDSNWPTGTHFPYYWMRWGNAQQHCTGDFFNDGYYNLLNNDRFREIIISLCSNPISSEGLLVSGTINLSSTATLDPCIYLSNASIDLEPDSQGDYFFVLFDNSGNILSKSGFDVSFYMPDPFGGPVEETGFVYRIKWVEGIKRLELQDKNSNVLATREVSSNKPIVNILYPNGGEIIERGEQINVKWEASDEDGDELFYSLAVSADKGETWLPIDIDIVNISFMLDTMWCTSGNEYLIKVVVTDGFNTEEDVSDMTFTILLDMTPPSISVEKPVNAFYLMNEEIIPFILPVIIGEITIQVKVTDAFGISNASILIDNQMKFISSDPPYEWHWDEQGFGIHRLEIIAFDKNGNLAKKTIYMLKLL